MKNLFTLKFKRQRGFTLIELLVVVAIISLLSSIILAAIREARDKAKDKAIISQMYNMRVSAEQAYSNGSYGTANAANNCSGLLNSTYLTNFVTASKWPAVAGEASTLPTCYSDASGNGQLITAYSLWHKTNEGGWCFDSKGSSVSMSAAPGSESCVGGGGTGLSLGDSCSSDSDCGSGVSCSSGYCGGEGASCNEFGENSSQCASGTYCSATYQSCLTTPGLNGGCPDNICQTGFSCEYNEIPYNQWVCQ